MENEPIYSNSDPAGDKISNGYSPSKKKNADSIFSKFLNLGIEELLIYLLGVLFMMSGLLLFIYGLFMGYLYQFIMGFIFLIPGFILDCMRESTTAGK